METDRQTDGQRDGQNVYVMRPIGRLHNNDDDDNESCNTNIISTTYQNATKILIEYLLLVDICQLFTQW